MSYWDNLHTQAWKSALTIFGDEIEVIPDGESATTTITGIIDEEEKPYEEDGLVVMRHIKTLETRERLDKGTVVAGSWKISKPPETVDDTLLYFLEEIENE